MTYVLIFSIVKSVKSNSISKSVVVSVAAVFLVAQFFISCPFAFVSIAQFSIITAVEESMICSTHKTNK